MKFSKEDAAQDLKAQFTTKGKTLKLSDRTMSETLENLMSFATDETELAAFSASAFKTLDSMNGNHIKDTSDFVKTWNETHPAEVGATIKEDAAIVFDAEAFMKKLKDELITPLSQEISGIKAKTRTETLIQTAEGLFLAKKPDPKWKGLQDEAKEIVNERITLDMTAEQLADAYDKRYNKLLSASGAEGAYIPADGGGSGGGNTDNSKYVKILQENGNLPKPEAAKT